MVAADGAVVRTLGLLPPEALRGHRFIMFYGDHDHYLATSEDGIHWDEQQQRVFGYRSDAFHTLSYDDSTGEYVCYPRNTKAFIYPPQKGRYPTAVRPSRRRFAPPQSV